MSSQCAVHSLHVCHNSMLVLCKDYIWEGVGPQTNLFANCLKVHVHVVIEITEDMTRTPVKTYTYVRTYTCVLVKGTLDLIAV